MGNGQFLIAYRNGWPTGTDIWRIAGAKFSLMHADVVLIQEEDSELYEVWKCRMGSHNGHVRLTEEDIQCLAVSLPWRLPWKLPA
jgi:hypothetical protein